MFPFAGGGKLAGVHGVILRLPTGADPSSARSMAVEAFTMASRESADTGSLRHPASLPPDELAAECDFVATRRSGRAGRTVTKSKRRLILTHRPTGTKAEASERRTQGENRRVALQRLRIELALTFRLPIRRDAKSGLMSPLCSGESGASAADWRSIPGMRITRLFWPRRWT